MNHSFKINPNNATNLSNIFNYTALCVAFSIHFIGGNLTATETVFVKNQVGGKEETGSGIGSAALLGRSTSVQLLDCEFNLNVALNTGGLFATEAQVHLEYVKFHHNQAKEGAGLVLDRTTVATLKTSKFYDNTAKENGAGAIMRGEVVATIDDCEFGPNNVAENSGGGLLIDKLAKIHMNNVAITGNRATSGAGLRIQGKARVWMNKCEIKMNQGVEGAGISATEKSHVYIEESMFISNNATMRGGGIMMTHTNCPVEKKTNSKTIDTKIIYEPCMKISSTTFQYNLAGAGGGFFWRYRIPINAAGPLSSSESRDFVCEKCIYGEAMKNVPTGAGTNAMGTRILHHPESKVETGLQLYGDGVTIQIEVTDRYGLRSTLDDTTVCSISKDPLEEGDLGIDEGRAQSGRGVVSFDGIRFLGDGDTTYMIQMNCLIDGSIDMSYDTTVTVGWCEPGYAPIARICRPCQDRMYSLYGKWCLECPTGGNCTALHRSADGLPRGVGEPRALPGFWLYTAPYQAMKARCPSDWLDGQGHCNPSETLIEESGICIDREW